MGGKTTDGSGGSAGWDMTPGTEFNPGSGGFK